MKEGISNIWLIGIIMVFILIFACYITVTISYTDTFKMKNEVLYIIEKHKGLTYNMGASGTSVIRSGATITTNVGALQTINLYLLGRSYDNTGQCPTEGTWYGVKTLDPRVSDPLHVDYEQVNPNQKYYYCFAKFENKQPSGLKTAYYRIRLFYKFEFPALSEFLSIKVDGLTDEIYDPQDSISSSGSNPYSTQ